MATRNDNLGNLHHVSDAKLLAALDSLAFEHRALVAKVVAHLAEVDRRRLHVPLGYSSLYVYATERLGFSEQEAHLRISAARAAQRDDRVIAGLDCGALSLTTVKAVAPHLASHPELLADALGKSKRQVERVVAEKTGRNEVRTELRTRPLAGGQVELTCVVTEETAELLQQALDLTMHENPDRDCDQALAEALRLLVAKKNKPRGTVAAASERAVSGPKCCAFVGTDGRTCGETRFLQLDHVVPLAQGGTGDPKNLRWLCATHNPVKGGANGQYEAERCLGRRRVEHGRLRSELERQAKSALVSLGFSVSEAARSCTLAVARAPKLELDTVVRAALATLGTQRTVSAVTRHENRAHRV